MKMIRKAIIGLLISSVMLWGTNAMAQGTNSLYKQNDFVLGVGYGSMSITPGTGATGFSISGVAVQGSYYFTDNFNLGVQAFFDSGTTAAGVAVSATPLVIDFGYHGTFTNNFGYYGAVGYHTETFSGTGAYGSTSGFDAEVGLEALLMDHLTGNVGYKYDSISGGTAPSGASGSSIVAFINYLFY